KTMQASLSSSDLAKMGGMTGGSSDKNDKLEQDLKKLGIDTAVKAKTATSAAGPTTSKLFDDDDEELGSGLDTGKADALNTAEALSGYENPDQDILKDSGVSIFEQLSSRYRKSAFPIFFIKKKGGAAGEEANPPPTP
ncbi:MAG: hypothetical protein AABY86_09085, partial [Bdellovibrionota bacterium]